MKPMSKRLFRLIFASFFFETLGVASLASGLASSMAAKEDQLKQQKAQYKFQKLQSSSDADTARANAAILETQRNAFARQSGEQILDIEQEGRDVSAERSALAAAEGFGGGGTARSVQTGISRKVNRDVTRVRDSLAEQTSIFNQQMEQQLDQAKAFEKQATFAGKQAGKTKDFNLLAPSTWF